MSSIRWARTPVDIKPIRIHLNPPSVSAAGVRNVIPLFVIALGAASLGACAQSSVVTEKSELAPSRQAPLEHNRTKIQVASHGLASFYTEGTQTANGEMFNTLQLTAAHRTLPFGTRLRLTNVATGRSVTVRVNDRGPFVPGRVVDVSYSAAETLGMVRRGVAKVKIDILQ